MNIILIGLRATGKSNISRRLAVLTKRPVLSTDLLVSYEQGGRSIAEIVADHAGDWRPFREMEYEVVRKVAALDGIIVDAGGGMVVDWNDDREEVFSERKVALLKRNGFVVWLRGDPNRLTLKIQGDANRPPLNDQSGLHATEAVMHRRQPFYRCAADMVIDTEAYSRKRLALEILHRLPAGFSLRSTQPGENPAS